MDDAEDGIFDSWTMIEKQQEGLWWVSANDKGEYQIRMNVYAPQGSEEWKNIEIRDYAKAVRTVGP